MKESHVKNPQISISSLEIILAMATRLYNGHGEICSPAKNPFETEQALKKITQLIRNLCKIEARNKPTTH